MLYPGSSHPLYTQGIPPVVHPGYPTVLHTRVSQRANTRVNGEMLLCADCYPVNGEMLLCAECSSLVQNGKKEQKVVNVLSDLPKVGTPATPMLNSCVTEWNTFLPLNRHDTGNMLSDHSQINNVMNSIPSVIEWNILPSNSLPAAQWGDVHQCCTSSHRCRACT